MCIFFRKVATRPYEKICKFFIKVVLLLPVHTELGTPPNVSCGPLIFIGDIHLLTIKEIIMDKFKRTEARTPLASKRKVQQFVTGLVDHWVASKYSHEEIHERAMAMMADAVDGKHMVDDKPVYARAMGGMLKAEGCFLDNTRVVTGGKSISDSPYA
jgi:hypothetical protein